ncbi:MAG: hypothetical protein ISR64_05055 [Deltaproteobacteria bacterium]|nr:hypothetical protein [Deltaproteobacteria bacterium]
MHAPDSRLRTVITVALVAFGCAALSCQKLPHDVDDQQPKALRISPGVLVKDSLEPGRGDATDWKDFSYYTDVSVTVVFAFGELYKPHGLRGEITLFSFDGNVIQRQPVVSEKRDYSFRFTARQDKDYFFKIEATKGASGYMVETKVTPLDVCSACEPGTTCCRPTGLCCETGTLCRNGACVRAEGCDPDCGRGEICVAGRCESACRGGCPRGKRCDVGKRRCVRKSVKPHSRPRLPRIRSCSPECVSGQTCNTRTGQCEGGTAIVGRVLSATEKGAATEILINRGSRDGVKRGSRGSVGSIGFTVVTVSATRCRAKIRATPDQVKGRKVRISK